MQTNPEVLLGGSLSWDRISRKDVSIQSQVDPATLTRVKNGQEGFSVKSARQFAPVAGKSPISLYAASQANTIHKRREAGELDDGQVLGAVGRVYTALKTDFGQDQEDLKADKLFTNALKALQGLAEAATKGATPTGTMEALGQDSGGLPLKKRQGAETTATKEKSVPVIMGKLGRNADGTARKRQI